MRNRGNRKFVAVFLICTVLFVVSGFMLVRELMQYKDGADIYGEAADFVVFPKKILSF